LNTTLDLSELEFKIGQLFMVGMPGPQMDDSTEKLIRDYHVGGVILFSRNIRDPLQLSELCKNLQDQSSQDQGTPLFLAIDQEGGRVARLKDPFTCFPGNETMAKDRFPQRRAREFGKVTAREMKLVGLNMNLAPVLDVRQGPPESHLIGRTFGEDPQTAARLGTIIIKTLQKNNIMACAKHFPGLGRADLDPHFQLPKIDLTSQELETINLPSFKAAIQADVAAIMTSHAIYPLLDPDRPATVSFAILTELLRKRLSFNGLIITDDLEMGAIAKHWGVAQGALAALKAGADILLICQEAQNVMESFHLIHEQLLRSEIPLTLLIQAAARVQKTKSRFLKKSPKISFSKIRSYFEL
jgi:beta-N-acetylhexosaminidase